MQIKFTKMHGLGNDFVVIDAINQQIQLTPEHVKAIADRRLGIGCDQILLVEASDTPKADFRYRIFNADGSEVEQCGNGARCFATFVREQGLSDKSEIPVITKSGIIYLQIQQDGNVTVNMGQPIFEAIEIPFLSKDNTDGVDSIDIKLQTLVIENEPITFFPLSMGNPHAVIQVENVEYADVAHIGKLLQADSHFPQSVNVGFMQIISRNEIKLRVYERGVGETLACGTGACAAVVAGQVQDLLAEKVVVNLPVGNLSIHWAGAKNPVMMTGPTATVFTGSITL